MLRNNRGMTLIEIMIVLIIVGGMMAILAPKLMGRLSKAKMQSARIQIGELGKALDAYNLDCGTFPSTDQGLKVLLTAPSGEPACANWGPDAYVKPNMLKDPWGHEFHYEEHGGTYTLKSYGRDGKEGGTGENADISNDDDSGATAKE